MPNWGDVIKRFATRKPNPRKGGRVEWSATPSESMHGGGNIVRAFTDSEGKNLYSYGRHFVLAIHLGKDAEGRDVFLKNGDRNSPTTNAMVRETQSRCYGPTVSLSALDAAGIAHGLTLAHIVDWREDRREYLYRDRRDGKFYQEVDFATNTGRGEFRKPEQGMWIPRDEWNADFQSGCWHVLGAVLIRDDRGIHYLCALDEGRYFVSKLAAPATTVDEAIAGLKPDPVREAEAAGSPVVRQGEWFFIPTGKDDAALAAELGTSKTKLRDTARPAPLPRDRTDSNVHEVRQYVTPDGKRYARGNVFHRTPGWRGERGTITREHRTVNLGDTWHLVHANTQQEAWSMGGSFD